MALETSTSPDTEAEFLEAEAATAGVFAGNEAEYIAYSKVPLEAALPAEEVEA